jgi:hypothetical protein
MNTRTTLSRHNLLSILLIFVLPVISYAIPSIPDATVGLPAPKFTVSDAIKQIITFNHKNNAADYIVVSAVYGRPEGSLLAPFQGGDIEVTNKNDEASWFVTLRSSQADSKRLYRLMDDGTILLIMHSD